MLAASGKGGRGAGDIMMVQTEIFLQVSTTAGTYFDPDLSEARFRLCQGVIARADQIYRIQVDLS